MRYVKRAIRLAEAAAFSNLHFRRPRAKALCVLDTAMGSDNAGDEIIMEACNEIIERFSGAINAPHIPTHYHIPECEFVRDYVKVLCGTNLVYKNMRGQRQWALPRNISSYANTCLLGVGMSDIGLDRPPSLYSRVLFKSILASDLIHSVRDNRTKAFFESIGIRNVVNTSCPTTWSLTPKRCEAIPRSKGRSVVTTITDYKFDLDMDSRMLDILKAQYETVYIWLQGLHDLDVCLAHYPGLSDCVLIPRRLSYFDELLATPGIDYVGTRLHAGIRAMNKGVRSLIISIDNRARSMGDDIGLPILERTEIDHLEDVISGDIATEITLPTDAINGWKAQFVEHDANVAS